MAATVFCKAFTSRPPVRSIRLIKFIRDVCIRTNIHICWFNFDALAQGNAYKPTKETINYREPGGDWTHYLQTGIYSAYTCMIATVILRQILKLITKLHYIMSVDVLIGSASTSRGCWRWDFVSFCTATRPCGRHPLLDSKVHGAHMGPTWSLSAPDGPHVGPMSLDITELMRSSIIIDLTCLMPTWQDLVIEGNKQATWIVLLEMDHIITPQCSKIPDKRHHIIHSWRLGI